MSTFIGRAFIVGQVSEVEQKTVSGSALAEFRLDGFGLRISAWKDLAAKVPAVGSTVMVEGKLASRSYTVDNKPRQSTEITASSIEPIGAAGDSLDFD